LKIFEKEMRKKSIEANCFRKNNERKHGKNYIKKQIC
jgi:hypothetical protein